MKIAYGNSRMDKKWENTDFSVLEDVANDRYRKKTK